MLLTFLYHRIAKEKYANPLEIIEQQITYLSKKYKIIVPGEKSSLFRLNICLTFDDAYFDFYHYVFPLLKRFQIKAQLAVPVKFIQDTTNLSAQERLSVRYREAMKEPVYLKKAPFCTWQELKEMSDSGLVSMASHSYNHKSLLTENTDLDLELIRSKKILEEKLNKEILTFVYPLGQFNEHIHKQALKHYKYIMRIGSSFNLNWQNINKISYRILSDNLKSIKEHLQFNKFISYLWFYFLNTFRGR